MLMPSDEHVDEPLLKDAQQEAAQWGAGRFAAEFDRREQEEKRLRDAEAGIFFRYPGIAYADDVPAPEMLSGPVDESVGDRVVETVTSHPVEIRKPKPIRHGYVPRPPRADGEPRRRRGRRRERGHGAAAATTWMPSPAELARMSPAGRRLYGLDG